MKKSSLFIIGLVTAGLTYGGLVAAVGPKDWTHGYHGYHHHGWHHHHDQDRPESDDARESGSAESEF